MKGLFILSITAEMFRNGCLESVCKAINDIPPSGQTELRGETNAENDGL